jgi:hypothetical protein
VEFLLDRDVPDGLSYLLEHLGHDVTLLRKAHPGDSSDEAVLQFAHEDDRTRAEERAALFRLLERAGETGLLNNVNFA